MKQGIHPKYEEATITCGCGEVVKTRSTKKDIRIEICSRCHPFYTGKAKLVDTMGRVEKFQQRYNWGKQNQEKPQQEAATPETAAEPKTEDQGQS